MTECYIQQVLDSPNKKKFEENIKFVFARLIKFLQKYFRLKVFSHAKKKFRKRFRFYPLYKQLEYAFYGYYFGCLAGRLRLPIEKFFAPRAKQSSKSQFEKLIPKSLSHLYFHHIKMSSLFVKDSLFFLNRILLNESQHKIIHKVGLVCINWEKKLFEERKAESLKSVNLRFLFDSKCKMPWSVGEVQNAIFDMIHLLN